MASLVGLMAVMAGVLPASAQSEVKSAIDGAGTAINNQLGDLFGVKKPPPKRRAKPAKPAAAKPATSKPAETRPAETRPAEVKPAAPKPVSPATAQADAPSPEPAVGATAVVPLPPLRPDNGTSRSPEVTPGPVASIAAKPVPPARPLPLAKPAPLAAPTPLASPPVTVANVPLPPRPPFARGSAPRLTALPAATASVAEPAAAGPVPPPRSPETETAALPPVREAEPGERAPGAAPAAPAIATICPELSNEDLAVFTKVEVTATQSACTVDRGVSMSAVRMRDGRMVTLEPAAVLRCEMAASVARWLREGVDPAVATLGSPLKVVMVAASQQCRPRNRVKGAKISEHGRGNAIDTRGYVLEDGRKFVIGGDTKDAKAMPRAFQELIKASACAEFTTILGPGSDGYHEEHLHVDRAVRRSTVAMCQWTIGGGGGR